MLRLGVKVGRKVDQAKIRHGGAARVGMVPKMLGSSATFVVQRCPKCVSIIGDCLMKGLEVVEWLSVDK